MRNVEWIAPVAFTTDYDYGIISLQDVAASVVRLIVIANVMLSPPDAYILLFTSLKYDVYIIRHGIMHGR